MDETLKTKLQELSIWESYSFPNGSNYKMQRLPEGNFGDVSISISHGVGYTVKWQGVESLVLFDTTDIGPGVDLGKHFNSRDIALSALL